MFESVRLGLSEDVSFPECFFFNLGNTSSLLNFKRIKEGGKKINHHNRGEREATDQSLESLKEL